MAVTITKNPLICSESHGLCPRAPSSAPYSRSPRFLMSFTLGSRSKTTIEVEKENTRFEPRRMTHVQKTHSLPPQKIEIFKSLEDWTEDNVLVHLRGSRTAEENRHGNLLKKYQYLSGQVGMRQIDLSDTDPLTENSPYLSFIYTSFQERATFISHGNTARHAKEHSDLKLAQICGTTAYIKIVEKLFEIDPNETILVFANMTRKKISKLAHLMYDGRDDNLVENFSAVMEFLVSRWKMESLTRLLSEGRKAQEYLCWLPTRFQKLEERSATRPRKDSRLILAGSLTGKSSSIENEKCPSHEYGCC